MLNPIVPEVRSVRLFSLLTRTQDDFLIGLTDQGIMAIKCNVSNSSTTR